MAACSGGAGRPLAPGAVRRPAAAWQPNLQNVSASSTSHGFGNWAGAGYFEGIGDSKTNYSGGTDVQERGRYDRGLANGDGYFRAAGQVFPGLATAQVGVAFQATAQQGYSSEWFGDAAGWQKLRVRVLQPQEPAGPNDSVALIGNISVIIGPSYGYTRTAFLRIRRAGSNLDLVRLQLSNPGGNGGNSLSGWYRTPKGTHSPNGGDANGGFLFSSYSAAYAIPASPGDEFDIFTSASTQGGAQTWGSSSAGSGSAYAAVQAQGGWADFTNPTPPGEDVPGTGTDLPFPPFPLPAGPPDGWEPPPGQPEDPGNPPPGGGPPPGDTCGSVIPGYKLLPGWTWWYWQWFWFPANYPPPPFVFFVECD